MASGSVNLGPDVVSGGGGGSGNATSIQGIPVSAMMPGNGQVLAYNSTNGDYEPASSGMGSVTSVGLALPVSVFSISGSPVTIAGTLTGAFIVQNANTVFAGPTTGAAATPAFRALVAADIPSLPYSSSTLTNTHLFVGNASNVATDVAVSGDLTLANTGAFTIANSAVTNAKIANTTIDLTTKVTGTLPVANGGTGVTSLAGTFVLNGGQAGAVTLGPSGANSLTLNTNGSARMTFLSGGNAGIGTITPGATLDVQSGTITTAVPAINMTQTWNNAATTFTGLLSNVTNTASNAASKLFDFQVGGVSALNYVASAGGNATGTLTGDGTFVFATSTSGSFRWSNNGTSKMLFGIGDWRVSGDNFLGWTSGTSVGTADAYIGRRTTASLQLGLPDAAAPVAQTFGVQGVVAGTTNAAGANFTINGSQGTGTGTGGSLLFQTAPAGTTGTAQNALATAVAIVSSGNVGVGVTSPNANAILDVTSTTKAFMPPRMSTTQKNAIASPTAGMVVYDNTLNKLAVYTGSAWETVTST